MNQQRRHRILEKLADYDFNTDLSRSHVKASDYLQRADGRGPTFRGSDAITRFLDRIAPNSSGALERKAEGLAAARAANLAAKVVPPAASEPLYVADRWYDKPKPTSVPTPSKVLVKNPAR